jgi:hypothetical protein
MVWLIAVVVDAVFALTAWAVGVTWGPQARSWLTRRTSALRAVERVEWPDGEGVFDDAWQLYRRIPSELRDSYDDLRGWLQEDATTEATEEIWLVARTKRFGPIRGVLYATLYKDPNRCFVSQVIADAAAEGSAYNILWEKLQNVVYETTGKRECEYYLEVVSPTQVPLSDQPERRRREAVRDFYASKGAKRLAFSYRVPDLEHLRPEAESERTLLYYAEPMPASIPVIHALGFVYGVFHLWAFSYGEDVENLDELTEVVDYFHGLVDRVAGRIGTDSIRLLTPSDL